VAKLATQRFTRSFQLASLAANATRPGVTAERVNHRASDAPLGKGLELDPAAGIEPVRGIDQAEYTVLHEIPEVD